MRTHSNTWHIVLLEEGIMLWMEKPFAWWWAWYSGPASHQLCYDYEENERYGNKVEILDASGKRLVYAHLREVLVEVGQEIKQAEIIGLSGCSGGSRIPHLHFEVRNKDTIHSGEENTINPLEVLPYYDLASLTEHFDEEPYGEIWEKFLENPWGLTDEDIPYSKNKQLIW